MPPEEKHKINVWIPGSLWKQVGNLGYENTTKATIAAFEALVLQDEKESNQEVLGSNQEALGSNQEIELYKRDITGYKENIKVLNIEIARLKEVLSNAPDPAELADLKARFEERQTLLEEKDKRIMELTEHKENMSVFANYFKSKTPEMIEAPVAERKKPWYKFW